MLCVHNMAKLYCIFKHCVSALVYGADPYQLEAVLLTDDDDHCDDELLQDLRHRRRQLIDKLKVIDDALKHSRCQRDGGGQASED